MLKKTIWGLIFGVSMIPVAATAGTIDRSAYTITVMDNGKKVATVPVATIAGKSAPFSSTQETAYTAESKIKDGKAVLSPGYITTGIIGVLRESRKNSDAIDLRLTDTKLLKMSDIVAGGQTINLPETSVQSFNERMLLQKGQFMVTHGFDHAFGPVSVIVKRG